MSKTLKRIVRSDLNERGSRRMLSEKYYNPFREPMIDGNLNGYDVLDGCEDEQILCDLPEKGWVEDIRMYSKMRDGGKTYCLYRRIDNGRYFFVEVFDDPRDDRYLHGRAVSKKKVPRFIWRDAVDYIRNDGVIADKVLKRIVKDELGRYMSSHMLSEAVGGGKVIRIDEKSIRGLLESVSLRFLSVLESKGYKGYQPIAHNKTVTLDNGTRTKSLVTLSDGAGRYDIGEDDSCYVIYKDRRHDEGTMYIFPELQRELKRLPDLPLH